MMRAQRVRVLIVDDSAFARKVLREVLGRSAEIEVVGVALDGLDALEKAAELTPDVITLDLVMPGLDGLGVLNALPAGGPRVVVVSTTGESSDLAVSALQAGAVDFVRKPTALSTDQLYEVEGELVEAVLTAARARPFVPVSVARPAAIPPTITKKVLVIGASTGGPQALTLLLSSLPRDTPVPVAVVVHMPLGFTEMFARRLDSDCAIDVVEAYDGLPLRPGLAVIARGGIHLKIHQRAGVGSAEIDLKPIETLHRPSVDVLFESAAAAFGAGVLGVVLTGMGDDGVKGARAIRAAGGAVLTEAESTCVVYGMPRSVVEAGLSSAEVRIEAMVASILNHL